MIKTQRPYFFYFVNARPVAKFKGKKTYISTGDSDDMSQGGLVTYDSRPSRANVSPKVDDIIFAKMANTEKTFLVDEEMSKMIFSTGFFDISSHHFDPKYLYYLIQSDEFDGYKNAYSEGTTQISISDKRLKKIKITYETDISKQHQIADYLDKKCAVIDRLIEIKKKEIEEYEVKKYVGYREIISKYINNVKAYDVKYFTFIAGRIGWQGLTTADYMDSGPYLITGTDFKNDGTISFDTCVHISEDRYKEAPKIHVQNDDVLITKDGTVGKVALVSNLHDKCSLNSGVLLIRCNLNKCLPRYLYYYLKSSYFWDWFTLSTKEAATIVHLYQQQFKNFSVFLPPIDCQREIVNLLDEREKKTDSIIALKNKKIIELISLKKSLIYECVSGKKEVPND